LRKSSNRSKKTRSNVSAVPPPEVLARTNDQRSQRGISAVPRPQKTCKRRTQPWLHEGLCIRRSLSESESQENLRFPSGSARPLPLRYYPKLHRHRRAFPSNPDVERKRTPYPLGESVAFRPQPPCLDAGQEDRGKTAKALPTTAPCWLSRSKRNGLGRGFPIRVPDELSCAQLILAVSVAIIGEHRANPDRAHRKRSRI
jgi:hypothetical protein